MRPLSYSSISTYYECPLKFKLKYIDGLKEKPKSYFSFGSSLHNTLEFMYSFRPPPPSLEEVLKHYEANWISAGYSSEEEEEGYYLYGKKVLTEFYNLHAKDLKPPIAVELKFDLEIEGVPVTGFIDRIDKIEGDFAEIIDYKSGKRTFDKSQVEDNEQLILYQLAVEKALGIPVGKLTIYHLPTQTPVSVEAHTQKRIEDLKSKVLEVSKLIEKGDFPPKKGRFCPCDFSEHCPYYMHLFKNKGVKKVYHQMSIKDLD